MQSRISLESIENSIKRKHITLFMKRSFDITLSLIGLLFLSPIFIIIALIIKIDSKGSTFYKQIRVGRNGKTFKIYKFRTMVTDKQNKAMQITIGKDSRITKVGHFLRKYKLDELPQLFNVLLGDMSFVGPRPEVPKYVNLYTEKQKKVLLVRPGITDYASIEFRNESEILGKVDNPEEVYINEIMPKKIDLNYKYLHELSLFTDIKLIIKTVIKILK